MRGTLSGLSKVSRLLVALVVGCAAWRLVAADALTIATYNIENYTLADRVVDGTYRQDYPKPEAAKEALRAVVRALDADVLALQEMGDATFFEEFRRDLKNAGLDYPHAELLVAADEERHIAVLSRRPFVAVTRHTDLEFKYFGEPTRVKRGLLEVRFRLGADADSGAASEVTLFVVHLKSRYTDRADDPQSAQQRAGEAVAVRDRVLARFPDPATAQFLIVGDFNDSRVSRPVRAMLERGKTPISEWLAAADSRGEVWSHFYRKEDSYSRVDHMLVSPGLKPWIAGGAARICDVPETALASDHRPLVVVVNASLAPVAPVAR